jgi:hypothetical protein
VDQAIEDHLTSIGNIFATIRGHDSGCTSYGVDDGSDRWFVKVAYDADVEQLRSAGGRPHSAADSALNRFRARPVAPVERVLDTVIDVHLAVVREGFVAVDFYGGCLKYDAATEQVRLVDLDEYRPGPYILETDRQYGSRRFMAPEEFVRGSIIDERTTVYTLGRKARVLLGEAGHWRGSAASERVVDPRDGGRPGGPLRVGSKPSRRPGLTAGSRVAP